MLPWQRNKYCFNYFVCWIEVTYNMTGRHGKLCIHGYGNDARNYLQAVPANIASYYRNLCWLYIMNISLHYLTPLIFRLNVSITFLDRSFSALNPIVFRQPSKVILDTTGFLPVLHIWQISTQIVTTRSHFAAVLISCLTRTRYNYQLDRQQQRQ